MDKTIIAERLIKLRGNKTQKEVAEAVGVAQSTYAMYELAQRIPSDDVKIRISKYFKKTVQSIFFTSYDYIM